MVRKIIYIFWAYLEDVTQIAGPGVKVTLLVLPVIFCMVFEQMASVVLFLVALWASKL